MGVVADRPIRRVKVVDGNGEPQKEGSSRLTALARAWFAGWEAFASVAGGRAEDLVGGNPWVRRERDDAA